MSLISSCAARPPIGGTCSGRRRTTTMQFEPCSSRRSESTGYRVFYSYLNLAVGHAFKGEMDEAKTALDEALRLNAKLSVKWLTERKPVLQPGFEVLRKAGLPEE